MSVLFFFQFLGLFFVMSTWIAILIEALISDIKKSIIEIIQVKHDESGG